MQTHSLLEPLYMIRPPEKIVRKLDSKKDRELIYMSFMALEPWPRTDAPF